jgi:hypothetical protein
MKWVFKTGIVAKGLSGGAMRTALFKPHIHNDKVGCNLVLLYESYRYGKIKPPLSEEQKRGIQGQVDTFSPGDSGAEDIRPPPLIDRHTPPKLYKGGVVILKTRDLSLRLGLDDFFSLEEIIHKTQSGVMLSKGKGNIRQGVAWDNGQGVITSIKVVSMNVPVAVFRAGALECKEGKSLTVRTKREVFGFSPSIPSVEVVSLSTSYRKSITEEPARYLFDWVLENTNPPPPY